MNRRPPLLVVSLLAVAVLVLFDQWSKAAVFAWMDASADLVRDHHGHERYLLSGEWLSFMLSYNRGAAFGRFGDYPHFLVFGRSAAVLCLLWLLLRDKARPRVVHVAMVLVLAGAIGNLLDNLWFGGEEHGHPYGTVRDFIDVWFTRWDWHFPTFNVADSCISVGAVLWVLSGLFSPSAEADEDRAAPGGVARAEDTP